MDAGLESLLQQERENAQNQAETTGNELFRTDMFRAVAFIVHHQSKNIPATSAPESLIQTLAPVGEVPPPAQHEIIRRVLQGVPTDDVPKVAMVPKQESPARPPVAVRMHIILHSSPYTTANQERFSRALAVASIAQQCTTETLQTLLPQQPLEAVRASYFSLKDTREGSSLIALDPNRPAAAYVDVAFAPPSQRTPGLIDVDESMQLADYIERMRDSKRDDPNSVDVVIIADAPLVRQDYQYFGSLIQQPFLFVPYLSNESPALISESGQNINFSGKLV